MKDTIICDLDGTLADLTHRLHHVHPPAGQKKNWDAFFAGAGEDAVHYPVLNLLHTYLNAEVEYGLIFCSGRPERCREDTVAWLHRQGFHRGHKAPYKLYMRADGDRRDDSIVKQEILDKHINKDDVLFVLDDRQRVVDMWRKNGLRCFQVAPGDF